MTQTAAFGGPCFSANVDLWLEFDGYCVPLARVSPHTITPQWSFMPEVESAELVVQIDGECDRRWIVIDCDPAEPNGELRYRPADDAPF